MFGIKYIKNDEFKIQEGHLSPKAIKIMRLATAVAIISFPMIFLQSYIPVELTIGGIKGLIYIIVQILVALSFVVSLMFMVANSVAGRISLPDKYLDEWELEHKRKAAAFTWYCLSTVLGAAFLVLLVVRIFLDFKDISFQIDIDVVFDMVMVFAWFVFVIPILYIVWNLKPLGDDKT